MRHSETNCLSPAKSLNRRRLLLPFRDCYRGCQMEIMGKIRVFKGKETEIETKEIKGKETYGETEK